MLFCLLFCLSLKILFCRAVLEEIEFMYTFNTII